MQSFMRSIGGNSPQLQQQLDQQQQLMQDLAPIQRAWMPYTIGAMVLLTVAVVGMIIGSIKGLQLKPMAHRWMILGMMSAIIYVVLTGYVQYATQRDSQQVIMRHMNQTMQAGGPMPAPARAMAGSAMQAGVAIGLVFVVVLAFAKCVLYAFCIWYLLTPQMRQLFESDGSDRSIIDALSEAPT